MACPNHTAAIATLSKRDLSFPSSVKVLWKEGSTEQAKTGKASDTYLEGGEDLLLVGLQKGALKGLADKLPRCIRLRVVLPHCRIPLQLLRQNASADAVDRWQASQHVVNGQQK